MELTEKATRYIAENSHKVINTYRSWFHMEPTVGWMNDPNGLIYLNGEFHLFYQANPYSAHNEHMAWGHLVSKDLVKYREIDVALYPDSNIGESGCFSGSAFINKGELKLVYTKHLDVPEKRMCIENQFICHTKDNVKFVKESTPCVNPDELPDNIAKNEFRDPQIFYYDDKTYLIVGGRTVDDKGVILFFSGKDYESFHYDFYLGPYEHTYRMVECPSFIKMGDKDVIVYSTYGAKVVSNGHEIKHKVFYIIGKLNSKESTFKVDSYGAIDSGDAYYAPKVIENYKEPIIIAWMENWDKDYKNTKDHEWIGSFTFPRRLRIEDNALYQELYQGINSYIKDVKAVSSGSYIDRHSLNEFTFESDFSLVIKGINGDIKLSKEDDKIVLNMLNSNNLNEMILKSEFSYEKGKIQVLLDTSSVEVFIDNGKETITSRFYIYGDDFLVEYQNISNFVSKTIEVEKL